MTHVLSLKNVTKTYGSTRAMNNMTFEVPKGVVFALLGENGAGKTTAIRTLLGLETPDTGAIEVLGMHPKTHAVDIRRAVGYIPESPVL